MSIYNRFNFQTYCIDQTVADSACSATSYLTGVKPRVGTLGVNGNVVRDNCTTGLDENNFTYSIAKWAMDAGKSAGLVTTARVTHATPAGVYAHVASRDWEKDTRHCPDNDDIAKQMIRGNIGSNLKVILGGGRKQFLPKDIVDEEGDNGDRDDGLNLLEEWKNDGKTKKNFVWNREELLKATPGNTDYLLGLFESDHMLYHLEAVETKVEDKEPTLSEMVSKAIDILSANNDGFFLFVEGGKIDMGHHDVLAHMALDETIEMSKAVKVARDRTSEEDTLIVVSSDHSHSFSISGYPNRGNDIFGIAGTSYEDNIPYMTLSYANGIGIRKHFKDGKRVNPASMDWNNIWFEYPTTVDIDPESHGGDDVGVFASGPWAHLFTGTYESNTLPHLMGYAACIGDGLKAC